MVSKALLNFSLNSSSTQSHQERDCIGLPFTIIIPTYKRPILLQRAIKSALNQTYRNIIVLILDNASGDETKSVVDEIQSRDSRLQYICHAKNLGMLGQYQYGFDHVQTEYFSFLSDDDFLFPSFCEVSMSGFSQFSDCCFFASSTMIVNSNKEIVRVPLELWPFEGRYDSICGASEMIGKYPVPTTVAFRRSFLSNISIDIHNLIGWDCDFLLQLACKFPIAISKKITGVFFHSPVSLTANISYRASCESIALIIERVPTFGLKEPSLLTIPLREDLMILLVSRGEFAESFVLAKRLILQQCFSLKICFFVSILWILKTFPQLSIFVVLSKKIYTRRGFRFKKYKRYIYEIS